MASGGWTRRRPAGGERETTQKIYGQESSKGPRVSHAHFGLFVTRRPAKSIVSFSGGCRETAATNKAEAALDGKVGKRCPQVGRPVVFEDIPRSQTGTSADGRGPNACLAVQAGSGVTDTLRRTDSRSVPGFLCIPERKQSSENDEYIRGTDRSLARWLTCPPLPPGRAPVLRRNCTLRRAQYRSPTNLDYCRYLARLAGIPATLIACRRP